MSTSPKRLAAGQRRTLKAMADRLQRMSQEWEDVDGYNENELETLADQVRALSKSLAVEDTEGAEP